MPIDEVIESMGKSESGEEEWEKVRTRKQKRKHIVVGK